MLVAVHHRAVAATCRRREPRANRPTRTPSGRRSAPCHLGQARGHGCRARRPPVRSPPAATTASKSGSRARQRPSSNRSPAITSRRSVVPSQHGRSGRSMRRRARPCGTASPPRRRARRSPGAGRRRRGRRRQVDRHPLGRQQPVVEDAHPWLHRPVSRRVQPPQRLRPASRPSPRPPSVGLRPALRERRRPRQPAAAHGQRGSSSA